MVLRLEPELIGVLEGEDIAVAEQQLMGAATAGDGACALHAIFGHPNDGGELECPDAREIFQLLLPASLAELRHAHPEVNPDVTKAVVTGIWGLVCQAAAAIVEHGHPGERVEREASLFWMAIDEETQTNLLQFFQQKYFENRNSSRLTATLKTVARRFFVPANEEAGVRPLSLLLDYIPNCSRSYLTMSMDEARALHTDSGAPEDLSLLVPCRQNASLTKYQGLFQESGEYDDLRVWFFSNHRFNVHLAKGRPMLDMIALMVEQRGEEDALGKDLEACRVAVQERYECFGDIEQPDFFSEDDAWTVYRQAVVIHGAYWLSSDEAALAAQLAKRSVDVYVFNEEDFETPSTFTKVVSASEPAGPNLISIALKPGGAGKDSMRGHFSRVWKREVWDAYLVRCAPPPESDHSSEPDDAEARSSLSSHPSTDSLPSDSESGSQISFETIQHNTSL